MPSGMSLNYLQSTLVDISIMIRRACRSCGVVVLNACLYCPPLQVVTWVSTKYPNLDLRIACGCGNWKGLKTSSSWSPKWRCGSELFLKKKTIRLCMVIRILHSFFPNLFGYFALIFSFVNFCLQGESWENFKNRGANWWSLNAPPTLFSSKFCIFFKNKISFWRNSTIFLN